MTPSQLYTAHYHYIRNMFLCDGDSLCSGSGLTHANVRLASSLMSQLVILTSMKITAQWPPLYLGLLNQILDWWFKNLQTQSGISLGFLQLLWCVTKGNCTTIHGLFIFMMTSVTVGLLKAVCVFRVKTRAKIWQFTATLIQLWGNLYTVFFLSFFPLFFNLESRH